MKNLQTEQIDLKKSLNQNMQIKLDKKFKKELFSNIKSIPNFPYKHRKSIYFNEEKH
ncbi:MAG: hypothetical protein QM482_00605 [Sulfurospirillum sp.]